MKKYTTFAMVVGVLLIVYSLINFSLNQLWDWISTISLILGLGVTGVGIYYRRRFREKVVSKKLVQYGASSVLNSVIFLGILALLAFISSRHHLRADLTAKGLFSLADQTKKVLKNLDKEVTILAFYKKGDELRARDLLEEYAYHTKYITFEFIDPNQKPGTAKRYQVTQYGTLIVESGTKRETLTELNEGNLTNAILRVTREQDKVIYFTTGHGEKDIGSEEPRGYKIAAEGIRRDNYLVKQINLAVDKTIPDDCSVLVIAGPRAEFFQPELDSIREYVDNGGKLMVLLDPEWKPGLVDFLANYKIKVEDALVIDASGLGQLFGMGPGVPLVSKYKEHEIFKEFRIMTFYPEACPVRPLEQGDADVTVKVLFESTPNGWGEVDYRSTRVAFDKGKDLPGPVPMAVVATKKIDQQKNARILVVGDSDFAANAYIRNSGNYDLFLNMINWLAEEEDMITIRPKEMDDRRVNLTAKDSKVILYASVFALPLVIIITGVVIYYRRR